MERYEALEIEIIAFEGEDVITQSLPTSNRTSGQLFYQENPTGAPLS